VRNHVYSFPWGGEARHHAGSGFTDGAGESLRNSNPKNILIFTFPPPDSDARQVLRGAPNTLLHLAPRPSKACI
jgi:hypothetical protein